MDWSIHFRMNDLPTGLETAGVSWCVAALEDRSVLVVVVTEKEHHHGLLNEEKPWKNPIWTASMVGIHSSIGPPSSLWGGYLEFRILSLRSCSSQITVPGI